MKKIMFLLIIIVSIFQITSCNISATNLVYNNASEIQDSYYYYENEHLNISLISGQRETEYLLNGVNTPLKQYCVLMIEQVVFEEIQLIQILINENFYSGTPLLNPYNNNYVYDYEMQIDNEETIEVRLSINNQESSYVLNNATNNFKYSTKQCLKTAINKNNEQLKTYFINNQFNGEVFIRIIKMKNFDLFVYQFLFVDINQNSFQCLVNPFTNKVVSS